MKKEKRLNVSLTRRFLPVLASLLFLFIIHSSVTTAGEQGGIIKGFWYSKGRVIITKKGTPLVKVGRGDEQLAVMRHETRKPVPEDELKVGFPVMREDRIETREGICLIIEVNEGKGEIVLNQHTELLFSSADSEEKENSAGISPSQTISSTSLEFLKFFPDDAAFASPVCSNKNLGYYLRKGECFLNGMVGKIFFRNGAAWSKNTQWDLRIREGGGERPQKAIVTVIEGSVMLANDMGESIEVPSDCQSEMSIGQKPQKPLPVKVIPVIEWNRNFFDEDSSEKGK